MSPAPFSVYLGIYPYENELMRGVMKIVVMICKQSDSSIR